MADAIAAPGLNDVTAPRAADVVLRIEAVRFPLSDEKVLQLVMAEEFNTWFGPQAVEREVKLGNGDVVDFMVGDIAVEVKIRGSRAAIFRQVKRYCAHERVSVLVLATRVTMGLPPTVNGKPCFVASLGRAWL